MKRVLLFFSILFASTYTQAQSVLSLGLKGSLANTEETSLLNRVGGFEIDSYNTRTKAMVQVYGRWQFNRFYVQPEFRYSTYRFLAYFDNIDRENPEWSYYQGIGGVNLANDLKRFDIPLKVGYFLTSFLSVNAGIMNAFLSSERRSFYHTDKGRFHISDNVFDSQKKYYAGAIMGINLHLKRFNFGLDYDFPFSSLNNPVIFEGKAYSFNRKTRTITFLVGYDIVRFGKK